MEQENFDRYDFYAKEREEKILKAQLEAICEIAASAAEESEQSRASVSE